jgi:iron complex outermembrane receptor protein
MKSFISWPAMIAAAALPAFAEDAPVARPSAAPEVVTVTGSRTAPRSALESLAPVDVISREAIEDTSSAELVETLAALVPSFSVQTLPALDATIFVRPAQLRNLSPDQTLVLLNGKRLHRSAMMMNPSYGRAFQAPDLDQIPGMALRSIDVLRDGASALYGSDAIAGVINLNLDDSPGFRAFTQYGEHKEGDGEGNRTGARFGVNDGSFFFAVSGEYSEVGPTARSQPSLAVTASRAAFPNVVFPDPEIRWGKPSREALRLAITTGVSAGEFDLYAFGTYGEGSGIGDFNYRGPAGPFASLFADSSKFPGYNLKQVYPAGFTPYFKSEDQDVNLTAGAKREFANGFKIDTSLSYGRNQIDYSMKNSINASLGPNSPRAFDDGGVEQEETAFNVDASLPLSMSFLAKPAILAAGIETRKETFSITPGDPASYAIGPGAPQFACCSAGFPGFTPAISGTWTQESQALYADLLIEPTENWSIDGAVRFEDFSTFGSSTTYKLSSRLEMTPALALRATASTGFRAPTPAQSYSEGLSQFLSNTTLQITTAGRFRPTGVVADLMNKRPGVAIRPLVPEESENLSFGFVWTPDFGLQVTLDAYRIEIENRLNTTTTYTLTAAESAALAALNIPNVQTISQANFLQNDYDTVTEGFDLILSREQSIGGGVLALTAAYSHIDETITGGSRTLNPYSRQIAEDALPQDRATVSANYALGPIEVGARARFYGEWSDFQDSFPNNAAPGTTYPTYNPQVFGSITFVDLLASYRLNDAVRLSVGADNIFDAYPDKAKWQAFRGLVYSRNAPYSTDGAYYFLRADVAF